MASQYNPFDPSAFDPTQYGFLQGDQQYPGGVGDPGQAPYQGMTPVDANDAGRIKKQPVPTAGNGATAPAASPAAGPSADDISAAYNKFLGRAPGTEGGDYSAETAWEAGDPNWMSTIENSPEAQGYRRRQPAATAPQQSGPALPSHSDLDARLKSIFDSGGDFNQGIVNRRTESARETLDRQRKSQLANDQSQLASRGLLGSGPELTAFGKLNENYGNSYKNAVSDIYANESQNADKRMMDALGLATGLSESDLNAAINSFSANTARTLGLGNLALGNSKNANDYNLGLGQLGLNRDVALNNADNVQVDQLIKLLQQLYGGSETSAGGYW